MTKFDRLRNYLNNRYTTITEDSRYIPFIKRKEMILTIEGTYKSTKEYVVEKYRKALELAGFMSRKSIGEYYIHKLIPDNLSLRDLMKLAYPHRYKIKEK